MSSRIFATTGAALAKMTVLALVVVVTAGSNLALAATPDPDLEVFRVRCQIDIDGDPAVPNQVQIQGKARAELLDGESVTFTVTNGSRTATAVSATFIAGSASADWDTSPDAADPEVVVPATFIASDFAVGNDEITVTAFVASTGQAVSDVGTCAEKVSSQFRQDTKNVCTLKKFNRDKCKSGDLLPDGTIMP